MGVGGSGKDKHGLESVQSCMETTKLIRVKSFFYMHSISEHYEKNIPNLESELFLLKYKVSSNSCPLHISLEKSDLCTGSNITSYIFITL